MFRVIALAGITMGSLGFVSTVSTSARNVSPTSPSDTLILTSRAAADSSVRFILPLDDLKASFGAKTPWINIRGDTLEMPSPVVLVLKEQTIDVNLASLPGAPALVLEFSYRGTNESSRVYCVAEGSTLRVTRWAGEERPQVRPDLTMKCVTR
jgi:hypothetical protein